MISALESRERGVLTGHGRNRDLRMLCRNRDLRMPPAGPADSSTLRHGVHLHPLTPPFWRTSCLKEEKFLNFFMPFIECYFLLLLTLSLLCWALYLEDNLLVIGFLQARHNIPMVTSEGYI